MRDQVILRRVAHWLEGRIIAKGCDRRDTLFSAGVPELVLAADFAVQPDRVGALLRRLEQRGHLYRAPAPSHELLDGSGPTGEPPEPVGLGPVTNCIRGISRLTAHMRAAMLPIAWSMGGDVRRYCLTWNRINGQQVTLNVFERLAASSPVLWEMTVAGGGSVSGWRPSPDPRWAVTEKALELVAQYERGREQHWYDIWSRLTDRQRYILRALDQANAFAVDKRLRTADITPRAEGPQADPDHFKRPLSELATLGLIESKTGREGGYWLSIKGRELLALIDGDAAAGCA